jgi:hypothetical protein
MREVELWENEKGGKFFFPFQSSISVFTGYIPDRSEHLRVPADFFIPYLVFLIFTAGCSSKRLEY